MPNRVRVTSIPRPDFITSVCIRRPTEIGVRRPKLHPRGRRPKDRFTHRLS